MTQRTNTRLVAPSEKPLAAGRDLSARRRNFFPSMSFSAAGETPARKVAELPGFEDNYLSGEGFDGSRSSHHDVVALSQQRADKSSRETPSRPRYNKECRC